MKKLVFLFMTALCVMSFRVQAQNQDNEHSLPKSLHGNRPTQKQKLDFFAGGDFSTNFTTRFGIAPEIGVFFNRWFDITASLRYEMFYNHHYKKIFHAFGGSAYAEFILIRYFLADIGYEYLNYPIVTKGIDAFHYDLERGQSHALLVGIGACYFVTNSLRLYLKCIAYPIHTPYKDVNNKHFIPVFLRFGTTYTF